MNPPPVWADELVVRKPPSLLARELSFAVLKERGMNSRIAGRGPAWVLVLGAWLLMPTLVRGADTAKRGGKPKESNHWAFQAVRRPIVPSVRDRAWVGTPIDAFILARLE